MLLAEIYFSLWNYVSTLITPSDFLRIFLLPSDDLKPPHATKKDKPYRGRVKIGYLYSKHDDKICYKNKRFYRSTCSDKEKKLYYCHGFPGLIQRWGLALRNIKIVRNKDSVDCCVCIPSILYFTCWTFFAYFIPDPLITPCYNPHVWSAWNFDLFLNFWMHVMTELSYR